MARVARLEHPSALILAVDLVRGGPDAPTTASEIAYEASYTVEREMIWGCRGERCTARLLIRRAAAAPKGRALKPLSGRYAITGGLGGLGLRAAARVRECGVSHSVLASRTGAVPREGQGLSAQLRALRIGGAASVLRLDISCRAQTRALAASGAGLSGYLHMASDFFSASLVSGSMRQSLHRHIGGPKTRGGAHLRDATATRALQTALNFSSLAALAPARVYAGTAAYAAANAYLDSLSACSRAAGVPAAGIQMANVGGQGSGALAPSELAARPGMVRIGTPLTHSPTHPPQYATHPLTHSPTPLTHSPTHPPQYATHPLTH
jgi:hypothetical protein